MNEPIIRKARSGEEAAIHLAHMRSIREVCVKDHGEEEIKGWGNRPMGDRWIEAIKNDYVLVVEFKKNINGVGFLKLIEKSGERIAYIHALYFTPEVLGLGLGKDMMELFFKKAKEWQVSCIELESSITAFGFYKKYGFQQAGEKHQVMIGGYPVTGIPMKYLLNSQD